MPFITCLGSINNVPILQSYMGGWGTTYKFLCQPVGSADDKGTHRVSYYLLRCYLQPDIHKYFCR